MSPSRIRHALPPVRWPTEEEAARSLLYSPIRLGRTLVAEQRTWIPAMVPWRATDEGFVTPAVLDWYRRFAKGRPGTLVVEATGIRDVPSGPLLRIGHDRFLPGLQDLVARVRAESGGHTRLLIQVIDFLSIRRRPMPENYFRRHLAITEELRGRLVKADGDHHWLDAPESGVREMLLAAPRELVERALLPRELEALDFGLRERVTDVHLPHVRDLPRVLPGLFTDAADRAVRASTGSNSTSPTRTRWRRSSPPSTRGRTGTEGRRRTACGFPWRSSRRCGRGSGRIGAWASASSGTR
jgi:hypothetical protein